MGPWERVENVDLGGLGKGWIRVSPKSLDLPAGEMSLGNAFGRGGVHRRGNVVLRPYRRGGLVRYVNDRTYPSETRFESESKIHRALWEQGFPTVEPLGYAFRPHRWGVEGIYLTVYTEALPWPLAFHRTAELLPQFKRALGALWGWGLWAPDLNATNFIINTGGTLLALDWDRARWTRPGPELRIAYLRRLVRSLDRQGASMEIRALISSLGTVTE